MSRPLVVRLCNWIGDVVLSLPALELLQSHGLDLHLYGKGWAPTLLTGYPQWTVLTRAPTLRGRVGQLRTLRQSLQAADQGPARRADALAMPNSFSSVLELRLAGFRPAGYARDGRGLLLGQALPPGHGAHALESFWQQACALVGASGPPPAAIGMRLSPLAVARARQLVQDRGWAGGFVCIAPFAAGTVHKLPKKWPGFPAFAERLGRTGLPIVICPGPGEMDEARTRYPQAALVEGLPLDAYAALLSMSRLVVANDTGPAHLAAGVDAPLISVLGPTKVEQWAPWGPNVTVLSQRPDWPAFDQVLALACARLDRPVPPPAP